MSPIISSIKTNIFQLKEEKTITAADVRQGLGDLEQFLLLAQNTGAKTNVIQFWDRSEVEGGKLQEGHQKIKEVAQALNIPLTQTGEKFQLASQNKSELFRDSIHPTDEGQKVLAESIMEVLNPDY